MTIEILAGGSTDQGMVLYTLKALLLHTLPVLVYNTYLVNAIAYDLVSDRLRAHSSSASDNILPSRSRPFHFGSRS